MLILRLGSSLFLIGLLLAAVFMPSERGLYLFGVLSVLVAVGAVREFMRLMGRMGFAHHFLPSAAIAAVIAVRPLFGPVPVPNFDLAFISVVVVIAWLRILCGGDRRAVEEVAVSACALVMIVFPLSMLSNIYIIDEGHQNLGRMIVFYTIMVTKAGDIGAYCFGTTATKLLGEDGVRRIAPRISPKKTWEGTIGGLMVSVLVSWVLVRHGFLPPEAQCWHGAPWGVLLGALLFVGGFFGDLVESKLKRLAGVKDSGHTVPGMGGVLDIMDSLVLNAPMMYVILFYFILKS